MTGCDDAIGAPGQIGQFLHPAQQSVRADLANPARHSAMVAQGFVQTVTRHGEVGGLGGWIDRRKKLPELAERIRAIEVIGIDCGKGCRDGLARAPHGMRRAPWFGPPGWRDEAGR